MNFLKIVVLLSCVTVIECFSQEKSDIGIFFTTSDESNVFVEYRKPIGGLFRLKMGASYGNFTNNFFETGEIVQSSDSSVTIQRFYYSSTIGTLRLGIEKKIDSSIFSFGANLLIGYRNAKNAYYNELTLLVDSVWEPSAVIFDPYNNPTASRVTRHYISPGLQLYFAMNLPVSESFELSLFFSGTFSTDILAQETGQIGDASLFTNPNVTALSFDNRVGIGLRYKLARKTK